MTRSILLLGAISLAALSAPLAAQPAASVGKIETPAIDSPMRLELLKVQIVLDRAGFRPGKLDGLGGEFTQAAHDRYNIANDIPTGQRLDLSDVAEPFREYTLTEEDLEWVGKTASTPAAQEKLPNMPYANAWELIAEKFHADLDYVRELNPDISNPEPGTIFRVPDVEEFSMQRVVALNEERAAAATAKKKAAEEAEAEPPAAEEAAPAPSPTATATPAPAGVETIDPENTAVEDSALLVDQDATPTPTPSPTPEPTPEPDPVVHLVILREPRIIELYEDDKLTGSFPCTPGSGRVPVPVGTWEITSNILMPYFRYDKSVLKDGTRSDNAFNIPPGPNNYVGIVWMGINRKSVGIHGTNSPDQIGRNESSGCIRLANWDAFTVAQKVKKGTEVEVR
ncbi:MAG: L,D-transpeptidase [Chthoniobacterales bacterium]